MKTIHTYSTLFIVSALLASCTVSNAPYAYDDLYYSPSTDPVQQAEIDANYNNRGYNQNNNSNNTYNDRYNQDAGTNPNAAQYQGNYAEEGGQQTIPANQQADDVEYYDEDYAQTLQTINAPVRSFNTYDPYQRDRIMYTQNPVFTAPSLYGGYQFWDPFMPSTGLSVGWNSFNGWNVGVNAGFGFGCGRALNPYAQFYDPFWGNNWGFYDPFFGPTHGFNNWGWRNSIHAWNRFNPAYNNGYYNGFRDGLFNNYNNYAIGNNGTRGRRQIVAPRGNAGSRNVISNGGARPVRPGSNPSSTNGVRTNPTPNTSRTSGARPTRPNAANSSNPSIESRPVRSTPNTTTRPVRTTPERYKVTPNRPQQTRPQQTRPQRTIPTQSRPTTQPTRPAPRPIQSTPTRPTYNRPAQQSRPNYTRPAPQQARPATTPQPRQQSRPSYNNSRPTYSAPRSTGGSRGSSSPSGGSTRPSRR